MKKVASFASFFVCTRTLLKTQKSTKVFTFSSLFRRTFIVSNKVKKSMLQCNIQKYVDNLLCKIYMQLFFKDTRYCRKVKEKVWTP